MISVSNAFKQELQNDNRNYLVTVVLGVKDSLGDTVTLTLDNSKIMLNGLDIDDAVSGDDSFTAVGSTIINSVELLIDNTTDEFSDYDFDNAPCTISVGLDLGNNTIESFRKFTGFVDSPKYNNAIIALTVYDPMVKFNKPYDSTIVYPASTAQIIADACTRCGVEMNSAAIILDGPVTTLLRRPPIESTTYLDIISWIAAINNKFARCNAYGLLEIKWFDTTTLASYLSQLDDPNTDIDFTEASNIHYITGLKTQSISANNVVITGVKAVVENENEEASLESVEFLSGSTDYVIELSNNPFITMENAQSIVNFLGTQLIGLTFRKASISHLSNPTMEAGDIALVYDRKSRAFPILVTRTKFSVSNYQQTVCGAETPIKNTSVQYSDSVKNYIELRKSLKENTNTLNQRIATANGLYTTEIEDISGATITYLHNHRLLANSDIQIQVSDVGVLVTSDGTSQSPTWYGLTVNGSLIANILQAIGINADWITVGKVTSEDGDVFFDLERGYFAITNSAGLSRIVLRGWSAALIMQHRTSTDQDWDNSVEMGAQTTDTYEVGQIYVGGDSSMCAMQYYAVGNYANRRTFAYLNNNERTLTVERVAVYTPTNLQEFLVYGSGLFYYQRASTSDSFGNPKAYINMANGNISLTSTGSITLSTASSSGITFANDVKNQFQLSSNDNLSLTQFNPNNIIFFAKASASASWTSASLRFTNGRLSRGDLPIVASQIPGGGASGDYIDAIYLGSDTSAARGLYVKKYSGVTIYCAGYESSDERVKYNIDDTKVVGEDVINAIQHKSFNFKSDKSHRDCGYIAQQLQTIIPHAIVPVPQWDEEGNPKEETLCINDHEILTYATKAIQELSAKIAKLEDEIKQLKIKYENI